MVMTMAPEESAELAAIETTHFLDLPDGVHADVAESTYHARIPGVASKSALDLVLRSPAHYRAWLDGRERARTAALSLGTAVHMARLEPERFARTYVIAPDFGDLRAVEGRTTKEQGKANKTARDEWRREHVGAVVLDSKDGAATLGMVRAIAEHPDAGPLFEGGLPEVTLKWVDPETEILCKARVDYWIPELRIAVDLKTTTDAREWAFARSISEYGYHRQDAHYRRGFEVLGQPIEQFVFIAVEKEPPFDLCVYELDREDVADGRAEVSDALRTLGWCVANDTWPGYARGVRQISRPRWGRKSLAA
jgi:exodeoxyribonuclease VIII